MTRAAARFETYAAPTGPELMIARGPIDAPQLLLIQPLFEEGNFTRTAAADLLDEVAAAGIGTWLFDLPGLGDSVAPLSDLHLADWTAAAKAAAARVAAVTGQTPHLATIRGAALLAGDAAARSCWRLMPADGPALLRPLERAAALGDSAGLAGWPVNAAMIAELRAAAIPAPACPVRDVAWPAGAPPWRRAEPARDRETTDALAADLIEWIASCDAR